jgi:hypothetical protein
MARLLLENLESEDAQMLEQRAKRLGTTAQTEAVRLLHGLLHAEAASLVEPALPVAVLAASELDEGLAGLAGGWEGSDELVESIETVRGARTRPRPLRALP